MASKEPATLNQQPTPSPFLDKLRQAEIEDGAPAGLYASTWRVESANGTQMRNPTTTAAGHFQFIDRTHKVWEERLGRKLDRDNFDDALTMLRAQYQENVKATGGSWEDATRMYYKGTDRTAWGQPDVQDYLRKVYGKETGGAIAPAKVQPVSASAARKSIAQQVQEQISLPMEAANAAARQQEVSTIVANEAEDRAAKAPDVGFWSGFGGERGTYEIAKQTPENTVTLSLLRMMDRDDTPAPEGWRYDPVEAEKDLLNDGEILYMRENGTTPARIQQTRAEIMVQRDFDEANSKAGFGAQLAGALAGSMAADPVVAALSLGTVAMFRAAGVGASQLIKAGAGRAAVASTMAEAGLGGVIGEGIIDYTGKISTGQDYAIAAASGSLFAAIPARGILRQANANAIVAAEEAIVAQALREKAAMRQRALQGLPEGSSEQAIADEMNRLAVADQEAGKAMARTKGRNQIIPEDVQEDMRREQDGLPPKQAEVEPDLDKPTTPQEDVASLGKIADGGESGEVRSVLDTTDGKPVTLSWSISPKAPQGTAHTAKEFMQAAAQAFEERATPVQAALFKRLQSVWSDDAQTNTLIRFNAGEGRSSFSGQKQEVSMRGVGAAAGDDIAEQVRKLSSGRGLFTLLHELTHAATVNKLAAGLRGNAPPGLKKIVNDLEALRARLVEAGAAPSAKSDGRRYATTNLYEFVAQAWSDADTQKALAALPVTGGRTGLQRFVQKVGELLGIKGGRTGLDEVLSLTDQLIRTEVKQGIVGRGGKAPSLQAPDAISNTGIRRFVERTYENARAWTTANPVDPAKLAVLTKLLPGGATPAIRLAESPNPILRMIAGLVTETTTGAAGRHGTAAIAKHILFDEFIGTAAQVADQSRSAWINARVGRARGAWDAAMHGREVRLFNRELAVEIEARGKPGYQPNADVNVRTAADALEKQFEVMRQAQVDAGVLGADVLGGASARGYLPRALDGVKLTNATDADMRELRQHLSARWQSVYGWDAAFTDEFAAKYVERQYRRGLGSKDVDGLASGGADNEIVRDTLEAMGRDPNGATDLLARRAASGGGQSQTKARLDIDLDAVLPSGKTLRDFYADDPLVLFRQYASRTSGTVALTNVGVPGIRGVRELRHAVEFAPEGERDIEGLKAYDQVMAEMLGTPTAGRVASAGATNLGLLVRNVNLGGLVITQAAETYNLVNHLGIGALLRGLPALPRLLGDVGRMKKGGGSTSNLLRSLEVPGSEIGMSSYRNTFPMDAPNAELTAYVEGSGAVTRLLSAGAHLQGKVTGFRALMAAQHRMAAEQVVLKALRYIREGGNSVALKDMGFTDGMVAAFKADYDKAVKLDARGNVVDFDLGAITDLNAAREFRVAVHRGVSQIIQGAFVGERQAWMHNDYAQLLTQLRTFGITAMEKQWGRQRMNHGYVAASMMLLAQTALILPLHAARVQLNATGKTDAERDKFIKQNMHPYQLVRATMNYNSMTHLTGDILDILAGTAGGWMGKNLNQELTGMDRPRATSMAGVPGIGLVDKAFKAASGNANLEQSIKGITPGSKIPHLVPIINVLTRE